MSDLITSTVGVLNSMTPLAIIGLLGYVIFVLVWKKSPAHDAVEKLGTNDLTHMAESLDRIERLQTDMNSRLIYVQAALDGRKP